MEYTMPRLDPQYNPDKYPFRMAFEPTQEALEIKKIKQTDLEIFFDFLIKAKDVGLIVKPTPEKAKELQELGIDLPEYDVVPSTTPTAVEDFVQVADTFTNLTEAEKFTSERALYPKLKKELDEKFAKVS